MFIDSVLNFTPRIVVAQNSSTNPHLHTLSIEACNILTAWGYNSTCYAFSPFYLMIEVSHNS